MNEHSSKYKQPDFKYYVKPNTSCYDYYTFQDLEEACIRAKTLSLTEFPVSLLYEPIETEDGWRMKEIFIYMKGRAIGNYSKPCKLRSANASDCFLDRKMTNIYTESALCSL